MFVNRPDIYSATVSRSLLKTKRSAALVLLLNDMQISNKDVVERKK